MLLIDKILICVIYRKVIAIIVKSIFFLSLRVLHLYQVVNLMG